MLWWKYFNKTRLLFLDRTEKWDVILSTLRIVPSDEETINIKKLVKKWMIELKMTAKV